AGEGGGRPLVIFAFHRLTSASLMPSYFTGADFQPLRPLNQSSFQTAFEPERGSTTASFASDFSRREDTVEDPNPDPDGLDSNPRYSVRRFHSEILPDDRAVSVYLPPQYLEQKERRF